MRDIIIHKNNIYNDEVRPDIGIVNYTRQNNDDKNEGGRGGLVDTREGWVRREKGGHVYIRRLRE